MKKLDKIHEADAGRIPFLLIVGDAEENAARVTVAIDREMHGNTVTQRSG